MVGAAVFRLSPAVIRRMIILGGGISSAAYAHYNGVDFSDISSQLRAFSVALSSAGLSDSKQLREMYRMLRSAGGESAMSLTLSKQLASSPAGLDMLWSNPSAESRSILASMVHSLSQAAPGDAVQILARAPSVEALWAVVQASGIPVSSLSGYFTDWRSPRFCAQPTFDDMEGFLKTVRDSENPIPTELVLFFAISHHRSLPRAHVSAVIDKAADLTLTDTIKHKYLFMRTVDVLSPLLAGKDVKRAVPVLVRCMGNGGSTDIAHLVIRLLQSHSVRLHAGLVQRVFDLSQKSGQDKQLLLSLMAELRKCESGIHITEDLERQLVRLFFTCGSRTEQNLIVKTLSINPSPATVPDVVFEIEKLLEVSDYELSMRKKQIDSILSRPIDDSELYAFHDDTGDSAEPDFSRDETSLAQRLAILSDIIRHRLAAQEGSMDQLTAAASLLTQVGFQQLVPLFKSEEEMRAKMVLRALANVSTLARYISPPIRDQFVLVGRAFARSVDKAALHVHAKAELNRLEYNLRCLPIKTAPMLIDSFLPLSDATPTDSDVDLVFVHGLRGGLKTWRVLGRDPKIVQQLWPSACLSDGLPKARLLAFTYEAPLWYATHKQHYSEVDVKRNFDEMALSLKTAMADAGVGQNGKKVIFITFSMGGLVAKRALVDDENLRKNTLGIVFFATPHLGSPIADYAYYAPLGGLVSPFIADLSRKSKQVLSLHEAYLNTCGSIPTLSVCETAQSDIGAGLKSMVVTMDSCSACRSTGHVMEAGENVDHESVSKIAQDIMCDDPRMIALLEFLTKLTTNGDDPN